MSLSPLRLRMSAADWLLLIALSVLWGGAFFFAKVALGELPPLTTACVRVAIAATLLAGFVYLRGQSLSNCLAIWPAILMLALFNNAIPFSLIFWGQTHIQSGLASILNATTPLFTVLIAHLATQDEKITPARLTGVVVGFFGVAVMLGLDLLREIGTNVLAQVACLGAALSYAVASVHGRRVRGYPPTLIAAGQLIASTAMLALMAAIFDRPWTLPPPSITAVSAVAALAVLSTALAYIIYFRLLASAGATNAVLVTLLIPVTAILLGVLVLGEQLAPRHLAGMALIALGLMAIDGRAAGFLARTVRGET